MGDQKDFSIIFVFAMATLLCNCNPASSFILPRVTRTSDAIIIDFAGVGYAPFYQGKNYGEIADPAGNIPVSSSNPNPIFSSGWSYSYGLPSLMTPAGVLFDGQFAEETGQQVVKQSVQCGRGPTALPPLPGSRSLISERIDGGTEAKKGSWPFMVALGTSTGSLCGGTLLSETKVLLAAQCLERTNLFNMMMLTVAIGINSFSPYDARMTRRISKIVMNSKYDATTYANDIAIITLDSPVSFSKNVMPVCLPPASNDPDQYADQDAVVLGWDSSSKLKQGRVSIVSTDECKSVEEIGQYISNTNICVTSDRVNTCTGDIGGPVVVMSSPGTWTQVGIISYNGEECINGLKTRVSAFRAWIDQNMQN